jgi:hypothetical protein
VPPDVTWPLPELAAGAVPGLKPLVPEELAEPEFAFEEPAEEPGAAGRADADGADWDVGVAVGGCAVFPVACAGPGRVRATAPAAMALAAVTVMVTERILA